MHNPYALPCSTWVDDSRNGTLVLPTDRGLSGLHLRLGQDCVLFRKLYGRVHFLAHSDVVEFGSKRLQSRDPHVFAGSPTGLCPVPARWLLHCRTSRNTSTPSHAWNLTPLLRRLVCLPSLLPFSSASSQRKSLLRVRVIRLAPTPSVSQDNLLTSKSVFLCKAA